VEMLLLKFLRKPYVISIKEKLNPAFLRKYVYKMIDKSASKIIVISEFLKSLLKETIKNKEVRIIRASIEEDLCKKFISVTTVPQNKNKFNILNIGQIYPMKNQLLLIEAAGRLKNKNSVLIKFIGFVVDKKYYNYLLRKINDLRLQNLFEFRGALNKNEIFYEYLNSDAVVITAKEEGMSLVFVEALFFEKPVISTKVGVVPEVLVNGENGIILDEINSDMLAESIDNLIDNKILYNKFRNNSRITFENNFNLEKNLEEHLEIFYECINKKY
jgi:glycosyltransferase involved in cell wall biosynthesis